MVLTVFFLSHADRVLSSSDLVAVTAASKTCQAEYDAAMKQAQEAVVQKDVTVVVKEAPRISSMVSVSAFTRSAMPRRSTASWTMSFWSASRMTETVFPKELLDRLRPEAISPLVGWLAHEACAETKGLFEVGAGYIAKLRWERSHGHRFGGTTDFTPDDVARHWAGITDFTDAEHPTTMNESLTAVQRTA